MDYLEQRIKRFEFTSHSNSTQKREIFRCKLRKQQIKEKNIQFRLQVSNNPNQISQTPSLNPINHQKSIDLSPSMSKSDQLLSLKQIQTSVSSLNFPIKPLLKKGLIQQILSLTTSDLDPEPKSCILNIFSNILTVLSETQLESLEVLKVIDYLFTNLSDSSQEIIENSLWGIANYIASNENSCISSLNKGILNAILKIVNNFNTPETLQIVTWALLNTVHYESALSTESLTKVFEICEKLLESPDHIVKSETLTVVSAAIRRDNNKIEVFTQNSLAKKVFFYWKQEIYQVNLLKIAMYVVSGTHAQTQFMLDFGLLDLIMPLFKLKDEEIIGDLYFLISNVAGGTVEQAEFLINHAVFRYVIKGIDHENARIRNESSFIVKNLVMVIKEKNISKDLVSDVMGKVCKVLMCYDSELIRNYLCVFEWFVVVFGNEEFIGNGYKDVLQCILKYKNPEIFSECDKILDMYF